MWEKNKRTTECDKSTITYDVSTAFCETGTIKCEEKKNKRIAECDKSIVTCDVGTVQCEDNTIKCEKKKGNHRMWQKYNHMWYWYYVM